MTNRFALLCVTFLIGCGIQGRESNFEAEKSWNQYFKDAAKLYGKNFLYGTTAETEHIEATILSYEKGNTVFSEFVEAFTTSKVKRDDYIEYDKEKKVHVVKEKFLLFILKGNTSIVTDHFNKERKIALVAAVLAIAYWQRQRLYNTASYVGEKTIGAGKQIARFFGWVASPLFGKSKPVAR